MMLLPLLIITVPLVKDWYISFDYFCSEVVLKLNFFSGHLDVVYVIVYVTIWLTHGSINLLVPYTLTYTFVCGLWLHDFDDLYCSWSNNLPRSTETIFHVVWPTTKIYLKTMQSILCLFISWEFQFVVVTSVT